MRVNWLVTFCNGQDRGHSGTLWIIRWASTAHLHTYNLTDLTSTCCIPVSRYSRISVSWLPQLLPAPAAVTACPHSHDCLITAHLGVLVVWSYSSSHETKGGWQSILAAIKQPACKQHALVLTGTSCCCCCIMKWAGSPALTRISIFTSSPYSFSSCKSSASTQCQPFRTPQAAAQCAHSASASSSTVRTWWAV